MEVVVTTGAIKLAKLQSECHQQQTNTQLFTGQMHYQQCQSTRELDSFARKTVKMPLLLLSLSHARNRISSASSRQTHLLNVDTVCSHQSCSLDTN